MKTTDQATPRPWKLAAPDSRPKDAIYIESPNDWLVCEMYNSDGIIRNERLANAALIVQAVNEYDALCAVATAADEFIVNASSQAARFDLLWAVKKLAKLREGKEKQ